MLKLNMDFSRTMKYPSFRLHFVPFYEIFGVKYILFVQIISFLSPSRVKYDKVMSPFLAYFMQIHLKLDQAVYYYVSE